MTRRFLDRLYALALVLAALALVSIAVLVTVQVMGRIIDRALLMAGMEPVGIVVTSLSEIGGFLFVGATFLAMAGTFRAAGHVRVTMLTRRLTGAPARALTALVLIAALGLAGFGLWSSAVQAWDSWSFNSVSFGMARISLWIPQGVMTLGLAVFWVALADEVIALLRGGTPAFLQAENSNGADDGH